MVLPKRRIMMKVDRKLLVLPRRVRVIMTEGVGSNYWSYLLE